MRKFSLILFTIITIAVLGYALVTNHPAQLLMLTFLAVGFGLAFLRLFVNNSIKKMKGKHIGVKLIFFAVLLSIGLPIQSWFRTNVLMTIQPNYLIYCITMLVSSMVITTLLVTRFKRQLSSEV
ncbi:MFS transporter permease [Macrococcus equi]|uniref:MFS transporter permease n=1 Tax=Macrococcus equi TaxID=3395462 RepID=UPI0039BEB0DD